MSLEMTVPAVGESITEVTIAKWLKKDGDLVAADELLCELESDKATFELQAPGAGVLKIVAEVGAVVAIGGLIAKIEASAGATAVAAPAASPQPASAPTAAPAAVVAESVFTMTMPAVGESISEVTIATWNKKDGDTVALDEVLCEVESDKATFELNAPASGVLKIVAQAGGTIAIGDVICTIIVGGTASASVAASASPAASTTTVIADSKAGVHATPLANNILTDKGLDPNNIKGTGAQGKITKDDVLKASTPAPQAAPASKPAAAPTPVVTSGPRAQERTKMTSLRKTVARRLVAVKNETAMLTTFNEVDMKPVMDIRAKYKDKFKEKHSIGLGFMSFFTKAVTMALEEFPAVNAYIDGEDIIYNRFADISIAVSAPKGLVVPVIRNAEKMSLAEIEKEVSRLALLARDNKLTIDQMTGGTFTITNGGVFGSMLSTPIINAPQSAILGMHNIVERAVVVNGEIVVRPIMYVALSYDHRIIDGRESVGFLVRVKQLLEDPTRILLSV